MRIKQMGSYNFVDRYWDILFDFCVSFAFSLLLWGCSEVRKTRQ